MTLGDVGATLDCMQCGLGISCAARRAGLVIALGTVLAGAPAVAAPVQGGDLTPDAYELALQWTLASVVPSGLQAGPDAASPAAATGRHPASVLSGVPAAAVPDPGGYALMGLALVAAGLAAQRIARGRPGRSGQRGLSKKT